MYLFMRTAYDSSSQLAKKVVSDSLGLVDFAIGLVIFVLNLPDGQVLFLGEIQITEGLINPANQQIGFWGLLKWLLG